jgi:hypothetical protein
MFEVASAAIVFFVEQVKSNRALLAGRTFRERDLGPTKADLEATYLVRLFSRFEGVLRHFWSKRMGRSTVPRMGDLMDGIGSHLHMTTTDLHEAHEVRETRNAFTHASPPAAGAMSIKEARRRLGKFVRYLPPAW